MVDLFAGCGGFSLGLEKAGFDPIFVNELNDHARNTYLVNREEQHPLLQKFQSRDIDGIASSRTVVKDLLDGFRRDYSLERKDPIDLVVGGPPCQGYSSVGMRRSYSVERRALPANHLYKSMARFIEWIRPRSFIFENVEGLLWARWTKSGTKGEIFDDVWNTFRSIPDYSVKYRLVYSKDYGVPQNRPRIFVIGFRSDVFQGKVRGFDALEGGFLPQPKGSPPDLVDVLSDLVDPNFEYGQSTTTYPGYAKTDFQKRMRTDFRGAIPRRCLHLCEQDYSKHSLRIQKKFEYMINHGGAIHPAYRTKKFHQRVLPKVWGSEGPTITITSLPDDFVHYEQARSLTVRECARIQTFPDWYEFRGPRTTGGLRRAGNPLERIFERDLPKYTQIANAVPPDLAEAVGAHLAKILRSSEK